MPLDQPLAFDMAHMSDACRPHRCSISAAATRSPGDERMTPTTAGLHGDYVGGARRRLRQPAMRTSSRIDGEQQTADAHQPPAPEPCSRRSARRRRPPGVSDEAFTAGLAAESISPRPVHRRRRRITNNTMTQASPSAGSKESSPSSCSASRPTGVAQLAIQEPYSARERITNCAGGPVGSSRTRSGSKAIDLPRRRDNGVFEYATRRHGTYRPGQPRFVSPTSG